MIDLAHGSIVNGISVIWCCRQQHPQIYLGTVGETQLLIPSINRCRKNMHEKDTGGKQ